MTGMIGADPADVDRLAVQMGVSARRLEAIRGRVRGQLHSTVWNGPDADAIRRDWDTRYGLILTSAAHLLADAERRLHEEARQQVQASAASLTAGLPPGYRQMPASGMPDISALALSSALLRAADRVGLLSFLGNVDGITGILPSLDAARVLASGGALPAVAFLKRIPLAGTVLSIGEVALAWQQHGLHGAETSEAMGLGVLGLAANFTPVGVMGGTAFFVGTTIGKIITHNTQVDEVLARGMFSLAYGETPAITMRDKQWYATATPEQIAADSAKALAASAEAQRIRERVENPALFAVDVGKGLVNSGKGLFNKIF